MGTTERRTPLPDEDILALYERIRRATPEQRSALVAHLAAAPGPQLRFTTRLSSNTKVAGGK